MAFFSETKMARAKNVVSVIGSVAAAAMLARSVAREYLPPELQEQINLSLKSFLGKLTDEMTMIICEFNGIRENGVYTAIEAYLASRVSQGVKRVFITDNPGAEKLKATMEVNQSYTDTFKGIKFRWRSVSRKMQTMVFYNEEDCGTASSSRSDQGSFEVTFHCKHNELAMNEYLPYILNVAKNRKQQERTVKLSTNDARLSWTSVNLDHPATFATLAMDTEAKERLIADLDVFVERREWYRRVGKAWKRGYLLYGPPGTGKSSLIGAMANYLKFDIYDLELTAIRSNSELRRLLVETTNRSILVVEDIDCSVELQDRAEENRHAREQKITLSGFLNIIDGLWSSCGDERIIVFTTNRKDKLDPALLRPGRMDMHINMSYCTPCGFRLLASNYLGINQHDLFEEIEDLIGKVEITPAEVGEKLLKDHDPDTALGGLMQFLVEKKNKMKEIEA